MRSRVNALPETDQTHGRTTAQVSALAGCFNQRRLLLGQGDRWASPGCSALYRAFRLLTMFRRSSRLAPLVTVAPGVPGHGQ